MTLQCQLCFELVQPKLTPQGEDIGTTCREHLVAHASDSPGMLIEHMKRVSWLMDLLAFDSADDPEGYRQLLYQAVNSLLVPKPALEVVPS